MSLKSQGHSASGSGWKLEAEGGIVDDMCNGGTLRRARGSQSSPQVDTPRRYAQRGGEGEHPLPDRDMGDHLSALMKRRLSHPPPRTARADSSPLT